MNSLNLKRVLFNNHGGLRVLYVSSLFCAHSQASAENVRVLFRIRPSEYLRRCVTVSGQDMTVFDGKSERTFTFDWIGDESASQAFRLFCHQLMKQDDMVAQTAAYADDFIRGLTATIFAYGQTGSGKTYTMEGMSLICKHAHVLT